MDLNRHSVTSCNYWVTKRIHHLGSQLASDLHSARLALACLQGSLSVIAILRRCARWAARCGWTRGRSC